MLKKNLNLMINLLLEAIYSRTYLENKSLSGRSSNLSKKISNSEHIKSGLPENELEDISCNFNIKFILKGSLIYVIVFIK
jgi:hypothetical protein